MIGKKTSEEICEIAEAPNARWKKIQEISY